MGGWVGGWQVVAQYPSITFTLHILHYQPLRRIFKRVHGTWCKQIRMERKDHVYTIAVCAALSEQLATQLVIPPDGLYDVCILNPTTCQVKLSSKRASSWQNECYSQVNCFWSWFRHVIGLPFRAHVDAHHSVQTFTSLSASPPRPAAPSPPASFNPL